MKKIYVMIIIFSTGAVICNSFWEQIITSLGLKSIKHYNIIYHDYTLSQSLSVYCLAKFQTKPKFLYVIYEFYWH